MKGTMAVALIGHHSGSAHDVSFTSTIHNLGPNPNDVLCWRNALSTSKASFLAVTNMTLLESVVLQPPEAASSHVHKTIDT